MNAEPGKVNEEVADLVERLDAKRQTAIPYTEYGNAERLIADHRDDLIHVDGIGWLVWNGTRWKRDQDGEMMRRAKATVRRMREVAARIVDEKARDALWEWARKSETRSKLENTIALAASEQEVVRQVDDLDADPMLLNALNGTVDLRTGELRPHRREDLMMRIASVEYDPRARCPRWLRCLGEWMVGDEVDPGYLQRAIGYSLSGYTMEQCLFLLDGPGANGKTTFLETVGAALGDYGGAASASTFMTRPGRGVRSDLARLMGIRFVRAAEVEHDARFAEVLVKQMTGGDKLVASFLYQNEFEFRPEFKLWIAANRLPTIVGTDHAIWRRLRRIPFSTKIEKPDKRLPERLRDELPGILAWAVEGCVAWQREGLGVPPAIRQATQQYRREQDSIGQFLGECCLQSEGSGVPPTVLLDTYRAWCDREGREPVSANEFRASLVSRGLSQTRTAQTRLWSGIELRR